MSKRKQGKRIRRTQKSLSGNRFGKVDMFSNHLVIPERMSFYQQLLKKAIESQNKQRVEAALLSIGVQLGEKTLLQNIVSNTFLEVSYNAFSWYCQTFIPEMKLPCQNDGELEDYISNSTTQKLISDGLMFGQDFSFYRDENGIRHLKISPTGLDKLSPSTSKYINLVTDANLKM